MINIIIAEDEIIPRRALVKIINQESKLNCNIVADVGTGALVLPFLTQNHIDIVIADIRMPDMDGLELAKYINENYPDTDTIILTAYTNFDYAKSALQYKVKDYIVKPINKEEIHNSLEKLIKNKVNSDKFIRNRIEGEISEFTMEKMEFSKILKLPSLFEKIINIKQIKNYEIIIYICQTQCKQTNEQVVNGKKIINDMLKNIRHQFLYFKHDDEYIIISCEYIAKTKLNIIVREFYENNGQTIHIGISKKHFYKNNTNLEIAYKEAVYSINNRILHPKTMYFEYSNNVPISEMVSKDDEYEIRREINDGHVDKAMYIVKSIYNKCIDIDYGIYAFYLAIISILRIACEVYRSKYDDISKINEEKYQLFSFKSDLYHIKNKEELFDYISTILTEACNTKDDKTDNFNIIDDIVNYIKSNYHYDISLNQLATHKYYMNPSYLSRLFKQVIGKNFSKYVIEIRMEKARDLIENSDIKIGEVASYVGYNDLSNFIQTFKKYYNVTPSQLRKSNE